MSLKDNVIAEAMYWIGYLEKKSNAQLDEFYANAGNDNYTIFAVYYKFFWSEDYQAQPWCAMFVSDIFRRALGKEVQEAIMPRHHYCPTGVNQFKKLGRWHTSNPQRGDVIYFKDNTGIAVHVGIVEKVEGGRVYTIEGNTSSAAGVVANGGCVAQKSYAVGYSLILGYGRSDYAKYENGDELTVAQYDELKADIAWIHDKSLPERDARLNALENPMIYNYIDQNMPDWARPTVQKMVDKGFLKGNEKGELCLTYEMLRMFAMLDRVGVYGG